MNTGERPALLRKWIVSVVKTPKRGSDVETYQPSFQNLSKQSCTRIVTGLKKRKTNIWWMNRNVPTNLKGSCLAYSDNIHFKFFLLQGISAIGWDINRFIFPQTFKHGLILIIDDDQHLCDESASRSVDRANFALFQFFHGL